MTNQQTDDTLPELKKQIEAWHEEVLTDINKVFNQGYSSGGIPMYSGEEWQVFFRLVGRITSSIKEQFNEIARHQTILVSQKNYLLDEIKKLETRNQQDQRK